MKNSAVPINNDYLLSQQSLILVFPNLVLEISQIDDKQIKIKKVNKWKEEEYIYFVSFWLKKIISNPYTIYDFNVPIERKNNFQQLSDFIPKHFSEGKGKNRVQCKSKYYTIKRKIIYRQSQPNACANLNFSTFIIQEAKRLQNKNVDIFSVDLLQMQNCNNISSPIMLVTNQLMKCQTSELSIAKNQLLMKFIAIHKSINEIS